MKILSMNNFEEHQWKQAYCKNKLCAWYGENKTKAKREVRSSPDGKLQKVSYRSRPSISREHKKSVDEFGTTNAINIGTVDVETQKLTMLQLQV